MGRRDDGRALDTRTDRRGDPPAGVRAQLAHSVLMDVVDGCLGDALCDQGEGRPRWPRFQA